VNVGWADYISKGLHKSSEFLLEKKDTERRKGFAIITRSRHRRLQKQTTKISDMDTQKFGKGLLIIGLVIVLAGIIGFSAQPTKDDLARNTSVPSEEIDKRYVEAIENELIATIAVAVGGFFAIVGGLIFVSSRKPQAEGSSES
jgi:hypothetical protein